MGMGVIFRRPTVLPVHPSTWVRPAGNTDFRVTQRFDVQDSFYGGSQKHNAVDLGNFSCGGVVVAMAAGTVRRVKDNATALGAKTDALGLVIDHGSGITTEYWHLNGYSVAAGAKVAAGQQIAIVGRTGLGDVCHLHIEAKRNGVRFDPEPLIFGGSLKEQDDVKLPVALASLTYAEVGIGNRLRVHPTTTDGSLVTDKLERVQVFGSVNSEKWTIAGKTGTTWYYVGLGLETWYIATVLLPNVRLTSLGEATIPLAAADCSAQEQALAQARTKLARAATSAAGAAQAATATVTALR